MIPKDLLVLGSINNPSDINLKNNIEQIKTDSNILKNLNPVSFTFKDDDQNKKHASLKLDVEEDAEDDSGNTDSPFANSLTAADSDGNVIDGDAEDERLAQLFQENGFEFRFSDGVYYFESREELERAKDIIAAWDPNFEFPRMGVYEYGYGSYGSTTADREIGSYSNGVMEELETNFLKQLAGITK
jgi:hypothetical protein